ncbi:MAG: hypothetical protein J7L47_06270 [Candidatus Odinarchaeota archaeon]|nr:hypothetical protein [Candidatus Odinarchaeota archaeon]
MGIIGSYEGRVWKVDLSSGKLEKWTIDFETIKNFIGGSGVGWKLAADLIKPGVDPFSPDNPIIFNPSVLVGTLTFGTPKIILITKFPIIATEDNKHFIGDASSGGRYFAMQLKRAGCDHLIITGKAEKPVYLKVINDDIELVDASNLWGRGIQEAANELVRKEGEDVGTYVIGRAGERLVRHAIGMVDKTNSLGRGAAAVMGSKNLKAIVTKGSGDIKVARPDDFYRVSKELRERAKAWHYRSTWLKMGLAAGWNDFKYTQYPGKWPRDKWEQLYGEETRIETLDKVIPCLSCVNSCRLRWTIRGGEFDGERGFGSPFSNSATSGMLLDVEDYRKMIHLVKLGNDEDGIDFYTMTRMIDFVTALYQKGVITKEETGGLELKRTYETYLLLWRMTVNREGFGNVLADGWMALKQKLGVDPQEYWYGGICKGVDFIYDARPSRFHPLMLTFITRPRPHHGGAHTRTNSPMRPLGEIRYQLERWGVPDDALERIFTPTPYSGKFNVGRYTVYMENMMCVNNATGLCSIYTYQGIINGDDLARMYSAAMGFDVTAADFMKCGERIFNLSKLINVREGFTRKDDMIPETWLKPMVSPEGKIELMDYYATKVLNKEDIECILNDYYDERGWNVESGIPTREKLEQIGLSDYAHFLPS